MDVENLVERTQQAILNSQLAILIRHSFITVDACKKTNRIILSGSTRTYYQKQMVGHIAACERNRLEAKDIIIANQILVK